MTKKINRKKTSGDGIKLLKFVSTVFMVTIFMLILLEVKNQCRDLGQNIDSSRNELSLLKEEISFLESDIHYLSRADRIRKIVSEELNMYSPAPESLIVYLGDYK